MIELTRMTQRQRLRISSSKLGFSLVELMVAIAIGVTLIISLSAALITQQNDQIRMKQAFEANEIETEIRLLLNDPIACQNTVGAGLPINLDIQQIINADMTQAIAPPKDYSNLVTLTGFETTVLYSPPIGSIGKTQIELKLLIAPTNLKILGAPTSGDQVLSPRTIEIYVDTNEAGNMTGCSTVEATEYGCVRIQRSTFGTVRTVSCITDPLGGPEYRLLSCAMHDGQPSKNSWRRTTPNNVSNSCLCSDALSSFLSCVAICCRY